LCPSVQDHAPNHAWWSTVCLDIYIYI
jgi:hypothetical protein